MSIVKDMVRAHLNSGYSDLRVLGTTYEVYASAPDTFEVFGVDEFLHARYALAHDVDFDEACSIIEQNIIANVFGELEKRQAK